MKRSEVIKIMADKFKSGDIPEPYMWANDILDILERRIGMMPPSKGYKPSLPLKDGEDIHFGNKINNLNKLLDSYSWETEDV